MAKKTKQHTPLTQGVDLRDWLKNQPKKIQAQVQKQFNKKKREGQLKSSLFLIFYNKNAIINYKVK